MIANFLPAAATFGQLIVPCQCETSIPSSHVGASDTMAPEPTARAEGTSARAATPGAATRATTTARLATLADHALRVRRSAGRHRRLGAAGSATGVGVSGCTGGTAPW